MQRSTMIIIALLTLIVSFSFGQTGDESTAPADAPAADEAPGFGFTAGINLGVDSILDANDNPVSWNRLGFQPDISFGKFGIGLDLTMRFQMYPDPDTAVELYQGDWVPDYQNSGKSFWDLYLAKFMYIRYGFKGDPLYVKLGSIDDLSLGSGFIVGNYSNTRFLPNLRLFGLETGVDGALFDFPYVGVELLTGNLARFDVLGGRVYVRPLAGTEIPILNNLQAGFTLVTDREPDLYNDTVDTSPDPVVIYGADLLAPIITDKLFPLVAFTDYVIEPNDRWGWMIGGAGRLVGIITYGAQLRFLGPDFIPVYFDANYDLFRADKYDSVSLDASGDPFAGWFASLGLAMMEDVLSVGVSLDGPFKPIPSAPSGNAADYPHLRATASMSEELLKFVSFDFSYEKYLLGVDKGFWGDLTTAENAVITAAVNYHTGAAVLSLIYNLTYNADTGDFDITSSLQSTVKF